MVFTSKIKELFGVEPVVSLAMSKAVDDGINIYKGKPRWVSKKKKVKTINFAKSVCSEVARLSMLGTKITIDGSERAEWLQQEINKVYYKFREWVELGCAYGTVIVKPSTDGIDLFTPESYVITEYKNKVVTGVVFTYQIKEDEKYYTRFEYHHYVDKAAYTVANRCFIGESPSSAEESIDINETPWKGLAEDSNIEGMLQPAYGVLRTPQANNIDINSAIGLPVFSEAITELEDLDVAYSRNSKEIDSSDRILLLDSDRMMPTGAPVKELQSNFENSREAMGLPDIVKNVYGDGVNSFYQEINPQLNTEMRLKGINALLSQIGYKVGFSNGYFVFNESTGIQTATGVEAEQQRTIQFIKDVRDKIEECLNDVIAGLDMYATAYGLTANGSYEVVYDFGDITHNQSEEKARWWGYVVAGKVPAWMYFVKFEGMSEEESKAMVLEAQPKQPTLFGGEE